MKSILSITAEQPSLPESVGLAAKAHLLEHQQSIWRQTDRLLAGLLMFEWAGGILLAFWRSPRTWSGASSSIHPHVWAAIFLGAVIISLPTLLVLTRPGQTLTRHTIAIGQMLMSALLIHIGDGRIEMHFHIFGSLAFLAFYRDWRVLVTASVVVALDHLIGGIYAPQSVYGVLSASYWRTVEHAWWVVFEDLFLIGSCVQGVREMQGIAVNRALLEHSHKDVERQVSERTAELKAAQEDLLKTARTAGMAEIATSVLHNVGNVLNSVNVSATIVSDKLKQSEIASLSKIGEMIREHQPQIGTYFTEDEQGKMIPEFITDLATCLNEEQAGMLAEISNLSTGIEHIKRIVAAQQSMAKCSQVLTSTKPLAVVESAIAMQSASSSTEVEIRRKVTECPEALFDQHKVLQILINLLSNARQAVASKLPAQREITLTLEPVRKSPAAGSLRFQVTDNGVGIAEGNLNRIFSHGFTTKKEGHGFGLHSAANAAKEMGGSLTVISAGPDKGATFTLEIPVQFVQEETACKPKA